MNNKLREKKNIHTKTDRISPSKPKPKKNLLNQTKPFTSKSQDSGFMDNRNNGGNNNNQNQNSNQRGNRFNDDFNQKGRQGQGNNMGNRRNNNNNNNNNMQQWNDHRQDGGFQNKRRRFQRCEFATV